MSARSLQACKEGLMTEKKKFNVYILIICLFIATLTLYGYVVGHGFDDYPWHIKVGEFTVNNGVIPGEIFSWLPEREGAKTMFHEWLSGVVLYTLHSVGDADGAVYVGICTFVFFAVVLFGNRDLFYKSGNIIAPILTGALTAVGIFEVCSARPHMIGLILFASALVILRKYYDNPGYKLIWLMPFITVLWANTHGGTVLFSVALPLGYLLCSAIEINVGRLFLNKKPKKQIITFAAVSAADLLAGLINPYGAELYLFPLVYNNEACKKFIVEWQRGTLTEGFAVIGLIVLTLIVLFSKKKINIKDFGLVAVFLLMGLIYRRFGAWAAVVLAVFAAEYLFDGEKRHKLKLSLIAAVLMSCVVLFATLTFAAKKTSETPDDLLSAEMDAAIDELQPKRMFNGYNDGGVLIYNDYKVFIDSRAEAAADIIEETIRFSTCSLSLEEMNEFVDRYDFDAFFVAKDDRVNIYLQLTDGCRLVYEDDTYALYERTAQ